MPARKSGDLVSLGRVRAETRNGCTEGVDGNESAQRRSAFVTFDLEISTKLPKPRAHSGNSNTQRDAEFGAAFGVGWNPRPLSVTDMLRIPSRNAAITVTFVAEECRCTLASDS